MKPIVTIFLMFVLCVQTLIAQTDSIPAEPWSLKATDKIVKLSPFDYISVIPTFGADVEVKMPQSTSLQFGAAVIPSFLQYLSSEAFNDYDRMGGYRLRTEGRLYMPVKTERYLAFGLTFRHLIIRDDFAVGMEGVTNEFGMEEFAYFKNVPMVFHRFNTFVDTKIGVQRENENFAIDFYAGLSIRYIKVRSNSEVPAGSGMPERRGVWTLRDGHSLTYPTPIIGLKIGIL
jgi:hypothetical protein